MTIGAYREQSLDLVNMILWHSEPGEQRGGVLDRAVRSRFKHCADLKPVQLGPADGLDGGGGGAIDVDPAVAPARGPARAARQGRQRRRLAAGFRMPEARAWAPSRVRRAMSWR